MVKLASKWQIGTNSKELFSGTFGGGGAPSTLLLDAFPVIFGTIYMLHERGGSLRAVPTPSLFF